MLPHTVRYAAESVPVPVHVSTGIRASTVVQCTMQATLCLLTNWLMRVIVNVACMKHACNMHAKSAKPLIDACEGERGQLNATLILSVVIQIQRACTQLLCSTLNGSELSVESIMSSDTF